MSTLLGIDLGGTKIALARYEAETMQLQDSRTVPTHESAQFDQVMQDLLREIAAMKTEDAVALGVGVPGLVDSTTQRIVTMPNIEDGENTDPASVLTKNTGLPAFVINDADAFTLAEALEGAGKGESVVVGITLGTGVGGGIVMNGTLYRGARGHAGEIGHMLLRPGEPPYETDDKRGEVEQFLSGTAMGRRCAAANRPEEYLEGEVCEFMRPDVFREVAWLVTSLTHLLDPSVIVFGGSAGRALSPHLPAITRELQTWMLPGTPLPRLAIGMLPDAATRGAALIAAKSLDV